MGIENDPMKGLAPSIVKTTENTLNIVCEEEFNKAITFLEKYKNEDFANLLKELTEEERTSLFNELGGSFMDILEEKNDIEKTKEALELYKANIITKEVMRLSPQAEIAQKMKNTKNAIKMLKESKIL
jgi:hypothetical protein